MSVFVILDVYFAPYLTFVNLSTLGNIKSFEVCP